MNFGRHMGGIATDRLLKIAPGPRRYVMSQWDQDKSCSVNVVLEACQVTSLNSTRWLGVVVRYVGESFVSLERRGR